MHIIISGNPKDGFEYTGPFEDIEDAVEYADVHMRHEEYWHVPLTKPEE